MAFIEHPMTLDEVNNNYEVKIVKRIIKQKYPWIKDALINEEGLTKYNIIFMDMVIDPTILAKENDWKLTSWTQRAIDNDKSYSAGYLNMFFNGLDYEDTENYRKEIRKLAHEIHNSPALPKDLKLPQGRALEVGDVLINPGKQHVWK